MEATNIYNNFCDSFYSKCYILFCSIMLLQQKGVEIDQFRNDCKVLVGMNDQTKPTNHNAHTYIDSKLIMHGLTIKSIINSFLTKYNHPIFRSEMILKMTHPQVMQIVNPIP